MISTHRNHWKKDIHLTNKLKTVILSLFLSFIILSIVLIGIIIYKEINKFILSKEFHEILSEQLSSIGNSVHKDSLMIMQATDISPIISVGPQWDPIGDIIGKALEGIIEPLIDALIDAIIGPIFEALSKLIMDLIIKYVYPIIAVIIYKIAILQIIKIVYLLSCAFTYLSGSGIIQVIFNEDTGSFLTRVPIFFWATLIIVPLVLTVILFVKWIGIAFNKASNQNEQVTLLISNIFKMILAIIILPAGFFALGVAAQFLFHFITLAYTSSAGATDASFTISDIVYYSGNTKWNGVNELSGGYDTRYDLTGDDSEGWLEWGQNNDVFAMFIVSVLTMLGLAIVIVTVLLKIYEIALLFFISPILVAMYPLDDGERVNKLVSLSISKMLVPSVSIMSFYIFSIVNVAMNAFYSEISNNLPDDDEFFKTGILMIIRILSLLAGIWFIISSSSIIGQFIGESSGIRESLAGVKETTSTMSSPFSSAAGLASKTAAAPATGGASMASGAATATVGKGMKGLM